jgi:hypothetical protein
VVGDLALILVAPTRSRMHDVTVSGFRLVGNSADLSAEFVEWVLVVDRTQRFALEGNYISGGFGGTTTRGSSGLIEAGAVGFAPMGGDMRFPANVTVQDNRSTANGEGGLILATGADAVAFPSAPGVQADTDMFDTLNATVTGNDLSNSPQVTGQPGFGLRLFQDGPTHVPSYTSVRATVEGNTMDHDGYGVIVDAGFPFRPDARLFTGAVSATFSSNTIAHVTSGKPAIVSFTRYTATLCPKELAAWKYLQHSSYTLTGTDNTFTGAVIDNPTHDPIDARPLRNTLTINGNPVSPRHELLPSLSSAQPAPRGDPEVGWNRGRGSRSRCHDVRVPSG